MDGQSNLPLTLAHFDSRRMVEETRSSSDNFDRASSDNVDAIVTSSGGMQSMGKKYHRHTAFQIQELESYFNFNNHPNEKERSILGRKLSLDGKQVKFWFQNRRTQLKTQTERQENNYLKQEHEERLINNKKLKEALSNPSCIKCGGPAVLGDMSMENQILRVENYRLREKINLMSLLANMVLGRPTSSLAGIFHPRSELGVGKNNFTGINGLGSHEGFMSSLPMVPTTNMSSIQDVELPFEKSFLLELALRAMDELAKLVQSDQSMWIRSIDGEKEVLNNGEYSKTCPPCIGPKPKGFVLEATRASGMVFASSLGLVEIFMDSNQWADMFPCLIGRASATNILFGNIAGSRDGALQLMHAEFQALTPLIPVRQMKFIRFCKQHAEGLWAVVDVSIDSIREVSDAPTFVHCRRLPSGCFIQDMPNGYSKITWVEHTEYDENIIHNLYRPLLISGMGFGAQRWLASLQRQCNCLAMLMPSAVSTDDNSGISPIARRTIVKLAHRMTRVFCSGVCGTVYMWQQVGNTGPDTRLIIRSSLNTLGEPSGLVLSATSSVWIPVPSKNLFNFLRNEQLRSMWDESYHEGPMIEMVHIAKSQDPASYVSLLCDTAANADPNSTLILQETQTDESGSLIVYAPIEIPSMKKVLDGGDSASVEVLPSGFAIASYGFPNGPENGSGSLLTAGFQILVSNNSSAKLTAESIEAVNSLIIRTIQKIKAALNCI